MLRGQRKNHSTPPQVSGRVTTWTGGGPRNNGSEKERASGSGGMRKKTKKGKRGGSHGSWRPKKGRGEGSECTATGKGYETLVHKTEEQRKRQGSVKKKARCQSAFPGGREKTGKQNKQRVGGGGGELKGEKNSSCEEREKSRMGEPTTLCKGEVGDRDRKVKSEKETFSRRGKGVLG